MTLADFFVIGLALLQIIMAFFVPKIWGLFKSVSDLEKKDITIDAKVDKVEAELRAKVKENELKVDHMNGNLKQGMEYIRHTMDEMKSSISDIQNEMHEFFKHRRNADD